MIMGDKYANGTWREWERTVLVDYVSPVAGNTYTTGEVFLTDVPTGYIPYDDGSTTDDDSTDDDTTDDDTTDDDDDDDNGNPFGGIPGYPVAFMSVLSIIAVLGIAFKKRK